MRVLKQKFTITLTAVRLVSVLVWQWNDAARVAIPRMDTVHSCRNFDKVTAWAKEHKNTHFDVNVHVLDDIVIPEFWNIYKDAINFVLILICNSPSEGNPTFQMWRRVCWSGGEEIWEEGKFWLETTKAYKTRYLCFEMPYAVIDSGEPRMDCNDTIWTRDVKEFENYRAMTDLFPCT